MSYTNAIFYLDPISGSDTARTALTSCIASNPSGSVTSIAKTAHGLVTGAVVDLTLFTAWLNSAWTITVTSANAFTLDGAVWQATADNDGTVTPRGGSSKADAWLTLTSGATAARIGPGDTIRIIASPDETLVGNATWTENSKTVTLAGAVTADVDPCENAWTASANVTATADTSGHPEGSANCKLVIASGFTTGKCAYIQRIDETGAAGAHRYWRVNVTAVGAGTGYCHIAKLDMRTSLGGSNVATGGTAAADSVYTGGYEADKAFDGNAATMWHSALTSMPHWLSYDFGVGVTREIIEISMSARNDNTNFTQAPGTFTVQYSDDNASWTTSWTETARTWTNGETKTLSKPTSGGLPIDLSGYQQVSLWLYTTATIAASTLSLRLCSDTAGVTTVDNLAIPAIAALNTWVPITIDKGSALGSSINSVALYADLDPGTVTVYLDNIIACKASSSADSLSLTSLIGKVWNKSWVASTNYALNDIRKPTQPNRNGFVYKVTTDGGSAGSSEPAWPQSVGATVTDGGLIWTCIGLEDTWYGLQSIRGTTLQLAVDNNTTYNNVGGTYQGTTETVATYKRETLKQGMLVVNGFSTVAQNVVQDSGSVAGGQITYSGGWNRTDMSTQTGETWLDGQSAYGQALSFNGLSFITVNNINGVRWSYMLGGGGYNLRITNCHGNHCSSAGISMGANYPVFMQGCVAVNNAGSGMHMSGVTRLTATALVAHGNYMGSPGAGLYMYIASTWDINYASIRGNSQGFYANAAGIIANVRNLTTKNNSAAGVNAPYGGVVVFNGDLTDTTPFGTNQPGADYVVRVSKYLGDAASHYNWFDYGTIKSATDQRHTASGVSWKFNPTNVIRNLNYPLKLSIAKIACAANNQLTIKIFGRRTTTDIKGRLFLPGGQILGVGGDLYEDLNPSINTWTESSSGIVFTPTEDGVVEVFFHVWDGVGTSASYWIDDMSVVG